MDEPHKEHKKDAPRSVSIAILSISSTRTLENDKSGLLLKALFEEAGHKVVSHTVVKDDVRKIRDAVRGHASDRNVDSIVTTGGTGLTSDDFTTRSIRPLFESELSGFVPIFMLLSYEDVGPACMVSQPIAGIINRKPVFCLPGSSKARELAARKIIVPELPHMMRHLSF